MAGISTKAAGKLENRFKFNSGSELENKEFSDGSGLQWYTTEFRKYDHQIGRFTGIDLWGELNYHNSGYVFGSNNPIFFNDPTGLLDSVGRNKNGETIYHNKGDDLPNVTVTPNSNKQNNVNWLSYSIFNSNYGGKTGRQIQNETHIQLARKRDGLPYLPYGDTAYFNRSWKADQDWRKMNYAVGGTLLAAGALPMIAELGLALTASPSTELSGLGLYSTQQLNALTSVEGSAALMRTFFGGGGRGFLTNFTLKSAAVAGIDVGMLQAYRQMAINIAMDYTASGTSSVALSTQVMRIVTITKLLGF